MLWYLCYFQVPVARNSMQYVCIRHSSKQGKSATKMERRSTTRVSTAQWEIMLDFLTENPSLVRGYHNSSRGREQATRQWSRLANLLNAEGSGASKSAKEWAAYFNNFKSKLKKLVSNLNREATATGGGAATAESLSEIERRVLSIMGPGFGQGLPSVRVNPFPDAGPSDARQEVVAGDIEIRIENWEEISETLEEEAQASGSMAQQPSQPITPPPPPSQPSVPNLPPSQHSVPPLPQPNDPPPPPLQPSVQPLPPSQPIVPQLERRTRRIRNRTRPMAPLDEARRILSEIERQRVASDAANARAMQLIGENLGRMATAL